jgi:hypothetical protein
MYTVRKGYVFFGRNAKRYEAGETVDSKLEAIAGQEWKLEKKKPADLPGQNANGPASQQTGSANALSGAAPAGSIWNKDKGGKGEDTTGAKQNNEGKSA